MQVIFVWFWFILLSFIISEIGRFFGYTDTLNTFFYILGIIASVVWLFQLSEYILKKIIDKEKKKQESKSNEIVNIKYNMNRPNCEECEYWGSLNCPNSSECYSTNERPYFKKKSK